MQLETEAILKTTLKERGPSLPVGIPDVNGVPARDILFRPWKMKQEKELGAYRDQHRDLNLAAFVNVVLAHLCTRIGPHDLESKSLDERQVLIGQMMMPDVFYAYSWLRFQAVGSDLDIEVACPTCSHAFTYQADLGSTEVTVADSLDATRWELELKDPFQIRGKDSAVLKLGPARWNALENIQGSMNTGMAKEAIIRGSIYEIPGHDAIALGPDELDEMSKRDLEAVAAGLDKHGFGPDLTVEDKCPKCSGPWAMAFDWGYDSFFGASSR